MGDPTAYPSPPPSTSFSSAARTSLETQSKTGSHASSITHLAGGVVVLLMLAALAYCLALRLAPELLPSCLAPAKRVAERRRHREHSGGKRQSKKSATKSAGRRSTGVHFQCVPTDATDALPSERQSSCELGCDALPTVCATQKSNRQKSLGRVKARAADGAHAHKNKDTCASRDDCLEAGRSDAALPKGRASTRVVHIDLDDADVARQLRDTRAAEARRASWDD